jgi:AbrB family looped-hinge helix DNA binding protein
VLIQRLRAPILHQDLSGCPGPASSIGDEIWRVAATPDFARRRVFDARLALTFRHYGVTEFATANVKDFQDFDFERVWNPLEVERRQAVGSASAKASADGSVCILLICGFELEITQSISTRFPSYDILIDMETVTLSPKFQVVIPVSVRKALKLAPGEKLRVFQYGDRVEFVPLRPVQELRGFLRGLDTSIEREEDRL